MRKALALTTAGLASLLASGCSLPSKERWAQINQHGLIPVLIDGRSSTVAANTTPGVKPSEEHAVRVQGVATPAIVKTPSADRVPGRTGYVYSPFTSSRSIVDVRAYQPGEAVRCPYTGKTFAVPSAQQQEVIVSNRPVRRENHPVTEVVSNSNSIPELDPSLNRLEPTPTPAPPTTFEPAKPATVEAPPAPAPTPAPAAASTPPPPREPSVAAKPKTDIPYGTRVAGRPGFVYSPFANKTQLVDVAGTAPGVVVKCPYTQKMFRVPEVAGEEVKPAAAPPSDTANAPSSVPAPAEPKPSTPGSLSSPPR